MNLSDLAGAVAGFAPTIASLLGGPLAGTAVSALEKSFGLGEGSGAAGIMQVIQDAKLTPEQIAAARASDNELKEKLASMQIDLETTKLNTQVALVTSDVTDRNGARLRESNVKDNTPKVLAYLVTLGYFGVLGLIGYVPMQPAAKEPMLILLGSLTTAWVAIVGYYFGSSSGAARGQELLAQSGPVTGGTSMEVTSK